eukprot:s1492_g6.t1
MIFLPEFHVNQVSPLTGSRFCCFPRCSTAPAKSTVRHPTPMTSVPPNDVRTAVPEGVRHSLLLQEEIAKISERSEDKANEDYCRGGSLERWQGPYWWKSLKNSKNAPPAPPVHR